MAVFPGRDVDPTPTIALVIPKAGHLFWARRWGSSSVTDLSPANVFVMPSTQDFFLRSGARPSAAEQLSQVSVRVAVGQKVGLPVGVTYRPEYARMALAH